MCIYVIDPGFMIYLYRKENKAIIKLEGRSDKKPLNNTIYLML